MVRSRVLAYPAVRSGSFWAERVAVLGDDRRNRIYWYQAPGTWRKLEGAQVFLDPCRRTKAMTDGVKLVTG